MIPVRNIRTQVLCVALSLSGLTAAVSQPAQKPIATLTSKPDLGGIKPLTSATLAEAIAFGSTRPSSDIIPLSTPMIALTSMYSMAELHKTSGLNQQMTAWTSMPYRVSFHSPFVVAAVSAAEAKRKYEPAPSLSVDELNKAKVVVAVSPSSDFTKADAIENVIIKRGATVVRALASRITPLTVQNQLGASRAVSSGEFTFDFSVFEPSAPITLVLVGPSHNVEVGIYEDVLRKLR